MAEFESIDVSRTSGLALEQHIRGHKLVQSEGDAWQGLETQIFRRAPYEDGVLVPAVAEPLIVWIIAGSIPSSAKAKEENLTQPAKSPSPRLPGRHQIGMGATSCRNQRAACPGIITSCLSLIHI